MEAKRPDHATLESHFVKNVVPSGGNLADRSYGNLADRSYGRISQTDDGIAELSGERLSVHDDKTTGVMQKMTATGGISG